MAPEHALSKQSRRKGHLGRPSIRRRSGSFWRGTWQWASRTIVFSLVEVEIRLRWPAARPLPLSARPFSMVSALARYCRLKSPRVARIIVRYTMINNARENCLQ
jgi:hypothetical protein